MKRRPWVPSPIFLQDGGGFGGSAGDSRDLEARPKSREETTLSVKSPVASSVFQNPTPRVSDSRTPPLRHSSRASDSLSFESRANASSYLLQHFSTRGGTGFGFPRAEDGTRAELRYPSCVSHRGLGSAHMRWRRCSGRGAWPRCTEPSDTRLGRDVAIKVVSEGLREPTACLSSDSSVRQDWPPR